MPAQFQIISCNQESISTIIDGINEYNLSKVAALSNVWAPLDYVIKDEDGNDIAGVLAGIGYWNGLEIKVVWVRSDYRNRGIGTLILKHVEKVAKEKGATIAMLDTFDFQAEEFYLKNGYTSIGEIKDFPTGHKRIYLSKRLAE